MPEVSYVATWVLFSSVGWSARHLYASNAPQMPLSDRIIAQHSSCYIRRTASFSYEMSKLNPARKHRFQGADAEQSGGSKLGMKKLETMCWMGHPRRMVDDA